MSGQNDPKRGGPACKRRSGGGPLKTDDRASFGGSFGLLFSVVVILSAITASVSIPDESVSDARPQAQVEAMGAGMETELDGATGDLLSDSDSTVVDTDVGDRAQFEHFSSLHFDERRGPNRVAGRVTGFGVVIPSHAWERIPEANRERLRARLGTFVHQMQAQQARDGELTRVEAAGEGIVAGVHLRQHGAEHTVEVTVVEPYTEEVEVVDYYTRVFDHYQSQWSFDSPGQGWERTDDTETVVVDRQSKRSTVRPGAGWERLGRVGSERIRTGTAHQYHWSDTRSGSSIYNRFPGYAYAGIVDSQQIQTGASQVSHWSGSKSDRSLQLLLRGYRYDGIVDTRNVKTGTQTKWLWWNQRDPGPDWQRVGQKQAQRGYRSITSPSHPKGSGWEYLGIDHVETKEVVSYKEKWIVGWYTIYEQVPIVQYKTERTWVPGRTEWIEQKKWVKGRYKTVTERKWVGWKTVTKKKWVPGRWKKTTTKKKVTSRERDCDWKWSMSRGFYKSCSTKKVTEWKTVTKKKWISGRWKTTTSRKWVGWKTVTKKKWASGHYETKTVAKEIPGYWKEEKVEVGVTLQQVPKTIWGPHKEKVKVTSEKQILHFKWRKPVYDIKIKYERPVYETRYQHRYERVNHETRFKHHYTRPQYDWQPVYLWQKVDKRTNHRWQKPIFRDEPVHKTVVVRKERTETVERDVETAPFVYDGSGDWTLARDVTRVRDSSLLIERTLLTEDPNDALQFVATSQADGSQWSLAVWRDGDDIVLRTSHGEEKRVRARFANVDFDAGTVNGKGTGFELADGISGPYTLSFENGENARGAFDFTIVGTPMFDGQSVNLDADEPGITVVDGVVYSATFDITFESDSTTYTDRITVEPSTEISAEDDA